MAFGLEAAHVDADLRDDHFSRKRADAGHGGQHFAGYAKGFEVALDLLIDAENRRIHGIQMIQMCIRDRLAYRLLPPP